MMSRSLWLGVTNRVEASPSNKRRVQRLAAAGTAAARSISSRFESLERRQLMADTSVIAGSNLFTVSGTDLYRSDLNGGSKTLLVHFAGSAPNNLLAYGDKLLFDAPTFANASYAGSEPWISDGTATGTFLLDDIHGGASGSNPSSFHLVNNRALFTADGSGDGHFQLFATDGTKAGTTVIGPYLNNYGSTVKNVDYEPTSVSWDYYLNSVQHTQRLTSDGSANYQVLYTETDANGLATLTPINPGVQTINITNTGNGFLTVVDDGVTLQYRVGDVQRFDLTDSPYGIGTDNDTFTVDSSVTVPVTFRSTGGSDTFTGGSGANSLVLSSRFTGNDSDGVYHTSGAVIALSSTGGSATYTNGDQITLHGIFTNITAGDGNDTIFGTSRSETLIGGSGNDSIVGNGGNDSLDGGLDNDTLVGSTGNDTLNGNWGNDSLNGGGGSDRFIEPSLPAGVTLANGLLTINVAAGDHYININGVNSESNDLNVELGVSYVGSQTIQVPADQVTAIMINGGSGNDSYQSFSNTIPTTINGGAGNDTIYGTDSTTVINGGDGDDSIYLGSGSERIDGGAGNDTILAISGNDPTAARDTIFGGDGNDSITAGAGNDSIDGGAGNDSINGAGGDDTLIGGAGANTLDGSDGDDVIYASPGDTITSSTGNDTVNNTGDTTTGSPGGSTSTPSWYTFRNGVLTVNGTAGPDNIKIDYHANGGGNIFLTFGAQYHWRLSQVQSIVVNAGAGDDTVNLGGLNLAAKVYGDAGNDNITGGVGNDRLYGGDGDDWIDGGAGNDILYGEAGNDRLFGSAGQDHLDAGSGTNLLRGGDGRDFLSGSKTDDLHANLGDVIALI